MSVADDWYDKDIEDFVLDVKNIKRAHGLKETGTSGNRQDAKSPVSPKNLADYGRSGYKTDKPVNRPNQANKTQNWNKKGTIPFHMLSTISEREPLEIFLEISKQFFVFFATLSATSNTPDRVLQIFIEILVKLCKLPLHETRKYILTKSWLKADYWKYLVNYVKRLSQHENTLSNNKNRSESNLSDLMSHILSYSTFYIQNLNYGRDFVEFLQCLFNNYCAGSENNRLTKIGMDLEHLILKANDNLDQKRYNEIYPTIEEIKEVENHRIHLKPNIVNGRYPDVGHYIEIHLALLKEYILSPLRDGIREFIADLDKDIPNIRVYEEVKFNIMKRKENQKYEYILIDLNLSHNDLNPRSLIKSSRLMLGSLLCFTTSPKFEDLILGIVTHRGNEILSKGMIQIDIIKMYNQLGNIFSQTFIMLESETHFEPYYQLYNVLKNLNDDNFPFKKYIIDCDTSTELPDYIPDKGKVLYTYRKHVFDVKDTATWPTAESIQLHESQFAAFQNALTRKFCTIQGAPGTGKTFIGLQIMLALLQNTKLQILIVCQTNYALDQFLMGILKYTDKIIRMGSKSKSPVLEQYNMKNLIEENFDNVDKRIRISYYNTRKEYTDFLDEFEALQNELLNPHILINRKHIINKKTLVLQDKMRSVSKRLADLKQISDFQLMKEKRVVAMTTAYAARCRSLLKMMRTPIVFIVETGEALESHIIASLTEDTQHVIMIGDHQQLRPTPYVNQLALEYKIDISLSERMITNGMNCIQLKSQYRQRPEFANLLRSSIYNELDDFESVHKYPNIKGMARNLFFIDHTSVESQTSYETTVRNKPEAQFLIYFCNYLILQGYQPSEITILTLHHGQMHQLLNEQQKFPKLAGVHVSVVDNFQGEENKIILLSLVRSNSEGTIGYLGMKNRICVALSRAREGFYIFGNMKLLRSASTIWEKIDDELIKQNAIGNYIPLQCQTHDKIRNVSEPREFLQFRNENCFGACAGLDLPSDNSAGSLSRGAKKKSGM